MFCQNCRTQNADNADFCYKCGSPLRASAVRNQGAYYAVPNPVPVQPQVQPYYTPPVYSPTPIPMIEKEKSTNGMRITAAVFAFILSFIPTIELIDFLSRTGLSIFYSEMFFDYLTGTILPPISLITFGVFLIAVKKPALFTIPFALWFIQWGGGLVVNLYDYSHYRYFLDEAYLTTSITLRIVMTAAVVYLLISSLVKPMLKAWCVPAILMTLGKVLSFIISAYDIFDFNFNSGDILSTVFSLPNGIITIIMYFLAFHGIYYLAYPAKIKVPASYGFVPAPAMIVNNPAPVMPAYSPAPGSYNAPAPAANHTGATDWNPTTVESAMPQGYENFASDGNAGVSGNQNNTPGT